MDGDVLHLIKELQEFEENIWYSKKYFQEFQDYRNDLRPIWDDSASRTVNMRYLEPNQEDSRAFIDHASDQYRELVAASKHISQIAKLFKKANVLSRQIYQLLDLVERDMADAAMTNELSRESFSNSEISNNHAIELINRANGNA